MKLLVTFALALVSALVVGETSAAAADVKQRYQVTVPKAIFEAALHQFGDELDVWHAADDGATVKADIYATEASINKLHAAPQSQDNAQTLALRAMEGTPLVQISPHPVNTQELLATRAAEAAACTQRTSRHLQATTATKYTDNAFFDCYRTADEVYAFFDKLVAENAAIFSKINKVSTTVEGRSIPAYKLSTGPGKKAIYMQAIIHAREWNAGTATFFTVASLLDGLRTRNATIVPVVDKYDWYFVPILNIDGYVFTHSPKGDRYWRKNRRPTIGFQGKPNFGVDLNRNFGPLEFFNKANDRVEDLTYAGPSVLSEPETAGIFAFLNTIPLVGALDIHTFSYGGLVLRPFGNRQAPAPEPYGSKLKTLGDNVMTATRQKNQFPYISQTSSALYLNYGSFIDSVFSERNHTATLCFEVEGEDFVELERFIRPGAQAVFQGVVQFAKELEAYYKGL